ncbi:MAG TPA: hypothetical protein VMU65_11825 [Candidatus Saccharimonadales bacterium]|nr:hypothetical protein [Candidatus Saccharimonadales bacterium]
MAMNLANSTVGMAPPENGYLSAEDKEAWSRQGVAFYIHGIELDTTNSYGERWILSVQATDGEKRRIGLGCNPRRDAQFTAMRSNLTEAGVGPLNLVQRAIGGGKSVWELLDAVDAGPEDN